MMHSLHLRRALLGMALATFWLAAVGRAQDADDLAAEEAKTAPNLPPVIDPTVRALLDTNPATPDELLRVSSILLDLRQPELALPMVKRLTEIKDEDVLAGLVRKFGSGAFVKIGVEPALAPDGDALARAALAAADRQARDPQRIAGLIGALDSPSAGARRAAGSQLLAGRDVAVKALVGVLQKPASDRQREAALETLARLSHESVGPLVAVVRGASPALRVSAIEALGRNHAADSHWVLLAPAHLPPADDSQAAVRQAALAALSRLGVPPTDATGAAAKLFSRARRLMNAPVELPADLVGQATRWSWDEAQGQLIEQTLSPSLADLAEAVELAVDAHRLAPGSGSAERLRWIALLELAAAQSPPGAPLPDAVTQPLTEMGLADLEALLEQAAAEGRPGAASASARALAQSGGLPVLYRGGPQPSILVQTARHPNRRVRMAALEAIMGLKPSQPFPGSSFVVEALGFFANSFGAPKALAGDARPIEAQRIAGLLAELGYETDAATTARGVLEATTRSPDYEVVLLDFTLAWPTSGQLVQQLRRDARTSRLPVGVLASSDQRLEVERLARRAPLVDAIMTPQNAAGLDAQLQWLLARVGRSAVPASERRKQAAQALAWLAELSEARKSDLSADLFQTRRVERQVLSAFFMPELAAPAAAVLARLGTASSQVALVDLASRPTQPLPARQSAAKAFAESVADFGTLLTTDEIVRQYDRYNQSEALDKDTQDVLALILDTMEARAEADEAR